VAVVELRLSQLLPLLLPRRSFDPAQKRDDIHFCFTHVTSRYNVLAHTW
jgi:hypothetical protein